jgi:hypothetical protein
LTYSSVFTSSLLSIITLSHQQNLCVPFFVFSVSSAQLSSSFSRPPVVHVLFLAANRIFRPANPASHNPLFRNQEHHSAHLILISGPGILPT